ncbi:cytochrome b-c1 complex subunit 8 [Microtus oregoni]|uniref:Cytochrome b-c1 complex subunit 8 n=1 Tax=Microtus ochrogaster TaxID=79684 RepID=A0A8J6KS53_MICOH|nr:cytochrome b-c1 complex subunit 8 [Microtus ochrogaster]XP_041521829.1 cytochrome b-c1 complex subunit 8 [Microtus oregoni]KAH0509920.1 Cytochrome b-c1 complex subunit 8 [Microtus ochrogaster]
MGREFGNLTRMRHVISYSLSPFEQRAFPNYFSKGIPNVLRRTRERILRVAPPFVAFYLIYTWGNQEFERSRRKDPAMYENDK